MATYFETPAARARMGTLPRLRIATWEGFMTEILVLYYSRKGSTAELARQVCRGIEGVPGAIAKLRTVPPVTAESEGPAKPVPMNGPPYATLEDLRHADGLILGSPTRFGNMAAPLKYFLDCTSSLWVLGGARRKTRRSIHLHADYPWGQEATLLSMMLPLLHHGMYLVGLPYTERALNETRRRHAVRRFTRRRPAGRSALSDHERALAQALGRRVAALAVRLRKLRRVRPL